MPEPVTIAHVYENTGPEADDFPWAVALDHHEPVGVFTEHSYALGFTAVLFRLLDLSSMAIVDKAFDPAGPADSTTQGVQS